MAFLRVDTRPLFPRLRAELASLLASLPDEGWTRATACRGWSIHAVAAHLLGVELGNVSVRRDGWALGPDKGEDPDVWLNAFNQQWVDAARRISPALLIELIDLAGRRFEEHLATLDLDATGGPVKWATGSEPAPVWELHQAPTAGPAACHVRTTTDGALKLCIRDPSAPPLAWQGDQELAKPWQE